MQQDAFLGKIISGLAKLSEASKAGATPLQKQKLFGSAEDIQKFLESMEGALAKLPDVPGLGRGVIFGNMTETTKPQPPEPEAKAPEVKPETVQPPADPVTPVAPVSIVLAKLLSFMECHKTSDNSTNRLDITEDKAVILNSRLGVLAYLPLEKDDFIALSLELSFIDTVSRNVKAWLGQRGHTVYNRDALRLLLTEDEVGDVESIDTLRLVDKEGKMGIHIAVKAVASNGGLDMKPCDILSEAQKFFDRVPNASSVVVQTGPKGGFAQRDFMVNVRGTTHVEHSTPITEETIRKFASYLYSPALVMPPGLQCEDVRLPNNVMFVITKKEVEEKPEQTEQNSESFPDFIGQLFKTVEKILQDGAKV